MVEIKTKLIILLSFVYQYFNVIRGVSCRGISFSAKNDNDKDDSQSKEWREKWMEHHKKWHMDSYYDTAPYFNVVRGKTREWSNLEHPQPIKRSEDSAAFPGPPLTNDLSDLNMSNPISKYHCPINLLYGNNLTVKNYFLLVPRGNESSNDTINQFQKVDEEKFDFKPMSHESQGAHGATSETETIFGVETTSVKDEASVETPTSLSVNTTIETTVENTTAEINSTIATELHITVSDTTPNETTSTQESTTKTSPPPTEGTTLAQEIMRTLDKYCETFNMNDFTTYAIQPVSINIGTSVEEKGNATNLVVDEKISINMTENATNSSDSNVLKKQKRTTKDGNDCISFNLSSNDNYTINPVPLPSE